MVSTNDIRPGQSILLDGTLYLILEYQHVKPGKGKAFVKTKLKNLSSGGVVDKTFRADEDVQQCGPLGNRIAQLETELAELKGNLVHGSAYAGQLIAGLQAADGRLEETVRELTEMMDWCMTMED